MQRELESVRVVDVVADVRVNDYFLALSTGGGDRCEKEHEPQGEQAIRFEQWHSELVE